MSTAADITDLILDTGAFERAFGQKLTARYGYQIAVDQVGPTALRATAPTPRSRVITETSARSCRINTVKNLTAVSGRN